MIPCPKCGQEMSELEFERAYLKVLNMVKDAMEKAGKGNLQNPDYAFLMDVIEIVKKSIQLTMEYNAEPCPGGLDAI